MITFWAFFCGAIYGGFAFWAYAKWKQPFVTDEVEHELKFWREEAARARAQVATHIGHS